jgi:hypothetical protein
MLTQNVVTATDGCGNIAIEHVGVLVTANLLIHPLQDRFGSHGGKIVLGELIVQREGSGEVKLHILMNDPLVSIDLTCFGSLDGHIFVCCGV